MAHIISTINEMYPYYLPKTYASTLGIEGY